MGVCNTAERSLAAVVGGLLGSDHELGEVGHGCHWQVYYAALVVDDGVQGGVAGGGEGFFGVEQLLALGLADLEVLLLDLVGPLATSTRDPARSI